MVTKRQSSRIKNLIKKTQSRLSEQFLFLLGGVSEIPKQAVNQILSNYEIFDQGFELLEMPVVSKFVEFEGIVETFISVAIDHPQPAEYINNCFKDCFNEIMPRVQLELLYLDNDIYEEEN